MVANQRPTQELSGLRARGRSEVYRVGRSCRNKFAAGVKSHAIARRGRRRRGAARLLRVPRAPRHRRHPPRRVAHQQQHSTATSCKHSALLRRLGIGALVCDRQFVCRGATWPRRIPGASVAAHNRSAQCVQRPRDATLSGNAAWLPSELSGHPTALLRQRRCLGQRGMRRVGAARAGAPAAQRSSGWHLSWAS